MSEKKTDLWVFNELIAKGYTNAAMEDVQPGVHVWAEKSDMPIIDDLLKKASKNSSFALYPCVETTPMSLMLLSLE